LKSTTKALIAAAVAVLFAAGLIVWQVKAHRAAAINLTAEDMSRLVEDQPPQLRARLATSEDERKKFAQDLRRLFALAEEARASGIADKPENKRQLELMHSLILAQMYIQQQQKNDPNVSPTTVIPPAEVEAFLKEPGQDKKFEAFIEDAKGMGFRMPPQLTDEIKTQMQQQWAQVFLAERKAKAAGLDKDRATQLQTMFQEARMLVEKYAEEQLVPRAKATDAEINEYLAKHPKLTPEQARAKADDVLKKIRGGGDFAALAKENSDDSSKEQGGELGWFGKGQMVKPFEDAAFSLKPGETSDVVETDYGFHIIQVEERREAPAGAAPAGGAPDAKPEEQVRARHILIAVDKPKGPAPFPAGQPEADQDRLKAKATVEQEKQKKLVEEIVNRSHVTVAENYEVKMPPAPPQMPMGDPTQGGGAPPDDVDQPGAGEEPPPAQANPNGKAQPAKPGSNGANAKGARPKP
jgi:parvulin-like peptidyl-prolyl isomerase